MIYLDNSATTFPKPQCVIRAVNTAMKNYSFNSGRGGYANSINTSEKIFEVRQKAGNILNVEPQNICFTQNCTTALNMAIKGMVKKGDHIIISNLEHNAVARAVYKLAQSDYITYDIFKYSYDDDELLNNIEKLINDKTSMIVCMQSSNVFGFVFPIKRIGKLALKYNLNFIVDGAQGCGLLETNCRDFNIDAYCVAGHKGLYGPMSTGFVGFKNDTKLTSIIEGGTGSVSSRLEQPDFFPDILESGSLNNSGIIGLGAGIDFVNSKKITNIYNHEFSMLSYVYEELSKNKNITLYTPKPEKYKTTPILSFNYSDFPSEKTASRLAQRGVAVRAGLHCSPLAHHFFNTIDRGTVRFSPSVFTTNKDCENFIMILKNL